MDQAVVTCDIIKSSDYHNEDWQMVIDRINRFITLWEERSNARYVFYRGDSLQGLMGRKEEALRQAIFLKAYINSALHEVNSRTPAVDIRISIGIGEVSFLGDNALENNGEAYRYSGRTLDKMEQKGKTIAFTSYSDELNQQWDVILSLLDEIMDRWTTTAAEIIWRLLLGIPDKEIAEELGVSQSAISQRKSSANWSTVLKTIDYFEQQFANKQRIT